MGATRQGSIDVMKILLEYGIDVNVKNNSGKYFKYIHLRFWILKILYFYLLFSGRTSLIKAAENGNMDIVKLLLEHGADINAKNKWGKFCNSMMILSMYL